MGRDHLARIELDIRQKSLVTLDETALEQGFLKTHQIPTPERKIRRIRGEGGGSTEPLLENCRF
jgi:hypothetical protein